MRIICMYQNMFCSNIYIYEVNQGLIMWFYQSCYINILMNLSNTSFIFSLIILYYKAYNFDIEQIWRFWRMVNLKYTTLHTISCSCCMRETVGGHMPKKITGFTGQSAKQDSYIKNYQSFYINGFTESIYLCIKRHSLRLFCLLKSHVGSLELNMDKNAVLYIGAVVTERFLKISFFLKSFVMHLCTNTYSRDCF